MQELEKYYQGKEVLITGGLGFIGSSITVKLVQAEAEVTVLDAELPRYGGNPFNLERIKNNVEIIRGDIRDQSLVESLVKKKDFIFNLAGQIDHNYSFENPLVDNDINCRGHLNVLESCKKNNLEVKIVYPSTRTVYGKPMYNPVDENHPTNPLSISSIHKLAAEKYYAVYEKYHGIKAVCFRITNPYGPGSQMKSSNYSILNWFLRLAMDDKEISVFGDGEQKRDYIFIDDLAEGMIKSASNSRTNGVYNISSGQPTRFIEMVNTVVDVVGSGKVVTKEWPENWKKLKQEIFM